MLIRRSAPVLIFLLARSDGFQQSIDSAEAEREKDSYAIYSLILTDLETGQWEERRQWAGCVTVAANGTDRRAC